MDAYIYAFLLNKVLNQAIFTDVDNVVLVFVNIEKKKNSKCELRDLSLENNFAMPQNLQITLYDSNSAHLILQNDQE